MIYGRAKIAGNPAFYAYFRLEGFSWRLCPKREAWFIPGTLINFELDSVPDDGLVHCDQVLVDILEVSQQIEHIDTFDKVIRMDEKSTKTHISTALSFVEARRRQLA